MTTKVVKKTFTATFGAKNLVVKCALTNFAVQIHHFEILFPYHFEDGLLIYTILVKIFLSHLMQKQQTSYSQKYNRLRIFLVATLLMIFNCQMFAQQDPAFAQYWRLESQYNPAAVGRTSEAIITGAYQLHAIGFDNSGGTMFLSGSTAFNMGKYRQGVGVAFQNDEFGLFSHKRIAAQYAFHTKLFGGILSIGIEADLLTESLQGSKADLADGNDPAFPTSDLNGNRIDASAGIFYQYKNFYAGVSALHLTAPTVKLGERNEIKYERLYNFTAGYNIKTKSPFITLIPSIMFRTDLADYRADITARLQYANDRKRFFFGASYAPQHSATLFIGGMFQGIELCYSYEANTEGMGIEAGHHELTLGYRLELNLGKRGRNLHRTVRWL